MTTAVKPSCSSCKYWDKEADPEVYEAEGLAPCKLADEKNIFPFEPVAPGMPIVTAAEFLCPYHEPLDKSGAHR